MTRQKLFYKKEVLGGITTFLTMVYIAFVNPTILHQAGMDQGAVFTATCLVTAFGCALTGLIANTPVAVAPGMALNIYFTYTVVQGMQVPWQEALMMVFVSGCVFLIISLTNLRKLLVESIPANLQIAILIGISLFIALIALENNHIIVGSTHTLVDLGSVTTISSGLFFLGFLIILILDYYHVKGAIILGILSVSLMSFLLGLTQWHGFMGLPPSLKPTLFQLDFSALKHAAALKATFAFFLIAVFDATGTLIGLLNTSMFSVKVQHTRMLSRSLTADAAASVFAGLLGSSSTSPFIESAAGIEAGGRTGLTAIVVAIGFLLLLFFYPLAQAIPPVAVGPALLYVACSMMSHVRDLKLTGMHEIAPCMITIMIIPFTSSIANGVGAGIILYTLLNLVTHKTINRPTLILSLIFIVFFWIN
jgi:AGZA family xanthine/uracil permease-like MFS transporter